MANYYSNSTGAGRIAPGGNSNFATVHDAASGTATANQLYVGCEFGGVDYYVNRDPLPFDTSGLPDDATISAASVFVHRNDALNAFTNVDTTAVCVVAATLTDPEAINGADYNDFGTTAFSTKNLADTTNGQWAELILDASGIAAISKTGSTNFGLRLKRDIDNSAPTGGNLICFDPPGGASAPYLSVTYTSPSEATSTTEFFYFM